MNNVAALAEAQLDLIEGRGQAARKFKALVAKRDAARSALTDGDRWLLGVLGVTLKNMATR